MKWNLETELCVMDEKDSYDSSIDQLNKETLHV